jgi:hypothetical protein
VFSFSLVRSAFLRAAVAFLAVGVSCAARAEIMPYTGTNIYGTLTTDVSSSTPVILGALTTSGNDLILYPVGLKAYTYSGGVSFSDLQLQDTICAKPGSYIDVITIKESGDYSLVGIGTSATSVSVSMTVASLTAYMADGTHVTINNLTYADLTKSADFNLAANKGTGRGWALTATLDLSDFGITGKVTSVSLNLDNDLLAVSESSSVALIEKKYVEIGVTDSVVPEPSTLALLFFGCVGTAFWAWRKRLEK